MNHSVAECRPDQRDSKPVLSPPRETLNRLRQQTDGLAEDRPDISAAAGRSPRDFAGHSRVLVEKQGVSGSRPATLVWRILARPGAQGRRELCRLRPGRGGLRLRKHRHRPVLWSPDRVLRGRARLPVRPPRGAKKRPGHQGRRLLRHWTLLLGNGVYLGVLSVFDWR